MVPWLQRFAVLAAIAALTLLQTAPSARAQTIILDTDGDGQCNDYWGYAPDTIAVWLDTAHNNDGSPATCSTGEDLTISAYEIVIDTASSSTVEYGTWVNLVPEFTENLGSAQGGSSVHHYYAVSFSSPGASTNLAPGKYLLGKVPVTPDLHGCPQAYAIPTWDSGSRVFETEFYSKCLGANQDNFIRLGTDFWGGCSIAIICDDVKSTTWGRIKERYR